MQQKGGIKWLRNRLYSRGDVPQPRPRRMLREDEFEVEKDWVPEEDLTDDERPISRFKQAKEVSTRRSPFATVFIFSVVFFVISAIAAAYLFLSGSNFVTAQNIDIEIGGPLQIAGGDELALNIQVTNRNSIPIEFADIIITYPDGTKSPADLSLDVNRVRETLGTIGAGDRAKHTTRAILFGKEDEEQIIKIEIEYRIQGSNAIFYKDREYNVLISSAPIALSVDALGEVSSGQEIQANIKLASNSTGVLENAMLVAEYPFGFEFTSATPPPTYGDNTWVVGDLRPGEERTIRVRGILVGEDTEERVFKFKTGIESESEERKLAAIFNELDVPVIIKRPFIHLALALDGNTSQNDHVAGRAARVQGTVSWKNNLATQIFDGVIEVQLTGEALDRRSIQTQEGFYRSSDDTIVFSKETLRSLEKIAPGDSGTVSFSFASLPLTPDSRLQSPTMQVEASVSGKRALEENVPESVRSSVSRNVRIASNLFLNSRIVHTVGPFTNTGPVPPRADQETTYTIIWSLANTANDITDASVSARLPQYVTWLNKFEPQSEAVTYDQANNRIIWKVGDVPAATGYQTQARQVAMQVAFNPSFSQVGSQPVLLETQTLSGLDLFTNIVLQSTSDPLSTQLTTDPNAPGNSGSVME